MPVMETLPAPQMEISSWPGDDSAAVARGRVGRPGRPAADRDRTAGRHEFDRVGDGQLLDIGAGADLDRGAEVAGVGDGRLDGVVAGMGTAQPRPTDRRTAVLLTQILLAAAPATVAGMATIPAMATAARAAIVLT